MIYITVAMYYEAKPFISKLALKRDNDIKRFQVFKNNEVALIISGVGVMASSIATTYLLTKYNANSTDLFINVGVCGSTDKEIKSGEVFLCHKIINHDSKKIFYPDMLFRHPFKEGVLESFSKVVTKDMLEDVKGDLVDMEGAAAYEAASTFLPPHQINCIKIVSDFLEPDNIKPEEVEHIVNKNTDIIIRWILSRHKAITPKRSILTDEEKNVLQQISENLKLSTTMNHQLIQLAKMYKIREGNLLEVVKPLISLKCESKREGKSYFAKLKEQLMEF
ncbi:hypothetical protein [Caldisalinibacter kiritimatiensis]|uniref:Nucleoside phosphorylase domain-containing protein n=1 Tax=Caldisalinibacter kiritimatiensis TaxID=1304284 RepID=R1CR90_9FIRM|nr:hypothetical protein [Caldisalinibacter kiritimatiensis]EOD01196.1 hypothetical protein L21TH_0735 [Caldisalinibacter kiritimatiensis]